MRAVTPASSRRLPRWKAATVVALLVYLLSACQPGIISIAPASAPPSTRVSTLADSPASLPAASPTTPISLTSTPQIIQTQTAAQPGEPQEQTAPTETEPPPVEPSPTTPIFREPDLPAEAWQDWPVIPLVPANAAEIYRKGLALGNDPHAFSILGDCQSLAETFLGVYDTNPDLAVRLPEDLQAAAANFRGSFDRQSPTIKGGTTAGAILWADWHENQYTCQSSESPLACELRLHKPSIVLINLGTHYETRNITYLRKILDELIAQGIVPILSTKADNREMDDRLNLEMAQLAVEYDLPLWNFWAAVSDLPNNGVGIKEGEEHLGEIYLSDEGLERHRLTALQAIAAVWQAVK